ncbi:hypothetical protein MTR_3g090727 [Medicago truncatula]|uniref:Uncharacterized protein n=1 Tax=Medicago truncatula TaxID=3880 RepID=A0A072V265_MEDTR|nr:hypothetical protein MTR_3g090727 [Medicago truncatula]
MVLEYNTQKPFPQQNGFGIQLTETISFLLLQLCELALVIYPGMCQKLSTTKILTM